MNKQTDVSKVEHYVLTLTLIANRALNMKATTIITIGPTW